MTSIAASLSSLQSTLSMAVLSKAMGTDAQSAATLLGDMVAANPTPAAVLMPRAGSMDISA